MSCKSIQLENLNKQVVTPGTPSGVITFKYSTILNISQKIEIIKITKEKAPLESLNFYSTNLDSGVRFTNDKFLDKGRHRIEISAPYNDSLKNSSEILVFHFLDLDNNKIILKKNSQIGETLRMK